MEWKKSAGGQFLPGLLVPSSWRCVPAVCGLPPSIHQKCCFFSHLLRRMLGLRSWQSKMRLPNNGWYSEQVNGRKSSIFDELKVADRRLQERNASLTELKDRVETVRQRFSSTPSLWPLYGRIASFFGYRVFPWSGFHSGIDISGSYGTAVKVTADGVVTFAGWQNGYGKTIVVD